MEEHRIAPMPHSNIPIGTYIQAGTSPAVRITLGLYNLQPYPLRIIFCGYLLHSWVCTNTPQTIDVLKNDI